MTEKNAIYFVVVTNFNFYCQHEKRINKRQDTMRSFHCFIIP